MSLRRALRARLRGPRPNDVYARTRKLRRVPDAELAVAEAALAGGGPTADRLLSQLREAPDVWRLVGDGGAYELRVSTTNPVRGVPRAGWRSRPITVRADPGGRPLELTLIVSMAGIVEIEGRTPDGRPWPEAWPVAASDLDAIRAGGPWLAIPTPEELRDQRVRAIAVIEGWMGEPGLIAGVRDVVAVELPTTADAVTAFEEAQGFTLPAAYRDLVLVANGFEIGDLVVLGTDDAYRLDIEGPARLVIAPPDETGALVLDEYGGIGLIDLEDATGHGSQLAPDLRAWLRSSVRTGYVAERARLRS